MQEYLENKRTSLQTGGHHEEPATSVAFSPDGACLASGAVDGSVLVWDAVTGDLLLRLAREGRDRLEPAVVRYSVAAELDPASPVGTGRADKGRSSDVRVRRRQERYGRGSRILQ